MGRRTLLLHAEQDLGDCLQFIRYAPLVWAKGATVMVECPVPLAGRVASCAGVSEVLPRGAARPPFDLHAAPMSLPGLLATRPILFLPRRLIWPPPNSPAPRFKKPWGRR